MGHGSMGRRYWHDQCDLSRFVDPWPMTGTYQVSRISRETRILDSISRSPAASSKSPAFYKQSQFPFNSTAKTAPRMHQNSPFQLKNRKIFWGEATTPPQTLYPSGEGDIGASLSALSASRSRRQSSSPASLFLNLGRPTDSLSEPLINTRQLAVIVARVWRRAERCAWCPSSRSMTATATATSRWRRRRWFYRTSRSTSRPTRWSFCWGSSTRTATENWTLTSSPTSTPRPKPRQYRRISPEPLTTAVELGYDQGSSPQPSKGLGERRKLHVGSGEPGRQPVFSDFSSILHFLCWQFETKRLFCATKLTNFETMQRFSYLFILKNA